VIGVNNLPKVVTQLCSEYDLTLRPVDRKSNDPLVAPPSLVLGLQIVERRTSNAKTVLCLIYYLYITHKTVFSISRIASIYWLHFLFLVKVTALEHVTVRHRPLTLRLSV